MMGSDSLRNLCPEEEEDVDPRLPEKKAAEERKLKES